MSPIRASATTRGAPVFNLDHRLVRRFPSLSRPTTTSSSATTAATTLMAPPIPLAALPLFILRVASPAIVLLSTLSLLFAKPAPPALQSPSPITSVVVATRTHRRALIYAFLSLAGLTYLLDGLTFVVSAVFNKEWPHYTGLDVNAVVGLVAFAGLAALAAWKEVRGVDVWSMKRFKVSIFFALGMDIAQVVLLALAFTRTSRATS